MRRPWEVTKLSSFHEEWKQCSYQRWLAGQRSQPVRKRIKRHVISIWWLALWGRPKCRHRNQVKLQQYRPHRIAGCLINEAEYHMKNYEDGGGCYPSMPQAEEDNTLRGLIWCDLISCWNFSLSSASWHSASCKCAWAFQVYLRQCTFRVVQFRKYSPNSRCRPSSCLLVVLAIF